MRVRALGVAMVLFGITGALASFGLWWMLYRYGKSVGDAAGVRVQCTQHCGGVGGRSSWALSPAQRLPSWG